MRTRGRRPRITTNTGEIAWTALAAGIVALLLVSSVAVICFLRTLDIGPKVGDILVFRHEAGISADWQVPVTMASGKPASGCVLRPDVMSNGGGSLVVESRLISPRLYRVHWAGRHTSDGPQDCGSTADLSVSRADLQLLINVVGGVGVERKMFAGF